jgi:inosine-uridine nucleoside N-ribohydrolase
MVDIIRSSPEEIVILAIAPYTNLQEALLIDPTIVKNSRIVAMGGSIYVGYDHKPPPAEEYNIA